MPSAPKPWSAMCEKKYMAKTVILAKLAIVVLYANYGGGCTSVLNFPIFEIFSSQYTSPKNGKS